MKKFIEEFKAFALRGNVMDMAVGVLIGSAFTGIVTALTTNCIQPNLRCDTGAKLYDSRSCRIWPMRLLVQLSISLSQHLSCLFY